MGTTTIDSPRTTRRSRAGRRRLGSVEPRPPGTPAGAVLAVRPAPPLDPPFEGAALPPAGMELLPVDWSPADAERRKAAAIRRRRAVPTPSTPPAAPSSGRPRTAAALGGEMTARAALQRYIGLCVEVLNGYRPVTHLRPATDFRHYSDVVDQLTRRTVRVHMSPGQAARHGRLVRVRRLVLGEPLDGIAEAAVVLEQGETCWAMAVRMERDLRGDLDGGWRCVVVQVI